MCETRYRPPPSPLSPGRAQSKCEVSSNTLPRFPTPLGLDEVLHGGKSGPNHADAVDHGPFTGVKERH